MISSVDEPVIGALLVGKFAQAGELGVHLSVDAAGTLADSGLSVHDLVTVLGNLVDNALDAAASGQVPRRVDVAIRSAPAETGPSALVIEVADTGHGVDADELDDVFKLGYSTKEPGTYGRGLGLALVRQAVNRLGGTLTVTRRVGAVFTVTIPLQVPAGTTEAVPNA
jgi:sensor histidine kinase regulating citrate/malate metabolism